MTTPIKNYTRTYAGGSTSAGKMKGPCGINMGNKVRVENGKWISFWELKKSVDYAASKWLAEHPIMTRTSNNNP